MDDAAILVCVLCLPLQSLHLSDLFDIIYYVGNGSRWRNHDAALA